VRERRSTAGSGWHALEGRARLREERYVGPVMALPQGSRKAHVTRDGKRKTGKP